MITIKRYLRRWAIYIDGVMAEGGFSTYEAARAYAAREYSK